MSKVDAQRAMREARYAAEHAAAAGRRKTPAAPTPAPAVAKAAPAVAATDDAGLCGHRSINNRTCRRPAGHAEKNHRYS